MLPTPLVAGEVARGDGLLGLRGVRRGSEEAPRALRGEQRQAGFPSPLPLAELRPALLLAHALGLLREEGATDVLRQRVEARISQKPRQPDLVAMDDAAGPDAALLHERPEVVQPAGRSTLPHR